MHKDLVRFVLIISVACVIPTIAMAACEDALVLSTYKFNNNVKNDWRLATLVTQSVWDEASHNGSVNAIIYGVPVGASYSDYHKRAENSMQSHNESYSHEQLLNIAWTGLDRSSVTAYQDCLQLEAARIPGLHLGVRAADSSSILLLVNWSQPGAGPIQVSWTRPIIEGQRLPINFPPGSTTISVPRPQADLNLAANSGGSTSEVVTLTPLPPPPLPLPPRQVITVRAVDFVSGRDVAAASGQVAVYGDVLLNAPPFNDRPNAAEWRITTPSGGRYRFEVEYASGDPRPVRVLVNGDVERESALNAPTCGFYPNCQRWADIGVVDLNPGDNVIRMDRRSYFPHLRTLRFTPVQ